MYELAISNEGLRRLEKAACLRAAEDYVNGKFKYELTGNTRARQIYRSAYTFIMKGMFREWSGYDPQHAIRVLNEKIEQKLTAHYAKESKAHA